MKKSKPSAEFKRTVAALKELNFLEDKGLVADTQILRIQVFMRYGIKVMVIENFEQPDAIILQFQVTSQVKRFPNDLSLKSITELVKTVMKAFNKAAGETDKIIRVDCNGICYGTSDICARLKTSAFIPT